MLKIDAVKFFEEEILPEINPNDKSMIFQAWSIYTDSLCKDGRITTRQYETWVNPF